MLDWGSGDWNSGPNSAPHSLPDFGQSLPLLPLLLTCQMEGTAIPLSGVSIKNESKPPGARTISYGVLMEHQSGLDPELS